QSPDPNPSFSCLFLGLNPGLQIFFGRLLYPVRKLGIATLDGGGGRDKKPKGVGWWWQEGSEVVGNVWQVLAGTFGVGPMDCRSGKKNNANAGGSGKGSKDQSQDQGQNLVPVWNRFVKFSVSRISEALICV
nr:hypothetical protein TSUD_19030 [Tanacetum cinerariifolium]